jgi:CheY-like chemotaxis protein
MNLEVACRYCNSAFLLDDSFAGAVLPCPSCGSPDGLARPPAAPVPAVAPRTVAAASTTSEEEVVCPRCKLHFVPRRTTLARDSSARPVVLVVEDMDYFRQVAADALSSRFEVRQASTVAEARAHLSQRIDLLLLDLTLDGGDHGKDLLRSLPRKPCPILIYTDQDESGMYGSSWEGLQRLGVDDVVMKGMNAGDAILRKVCALLGLPWDADD